MGFKGNWLGNRLYAEAAIFSTQIENLLVAQRTAEDQYVGVNAGSSSHPGLEFLVHYQLSNSDKFQITPCFSAALNNFKFKDFVDGNADYSGNELTGVPDKQWNFGLDVNTKCGWSLNTSYRTLGKIPLNDSNAKYSDAYSVLDIKTSYFFTILKVLKTGLQCRSQQRIGRDLRQALPDAVGFGTVPPRYFYPGNPVNFYGGFSVSYVLGSADFSGKIK